MVEIPKVCRYCGAKVVFTSNAEIYGKQYGGGMCYLCRRCGAYVGTHKGSRAPLGTMADDVLRYWRKQAHDNFDKLWKSKRLSRPQAYKWLATQMGLSAEETHIALFEVDQCEKVVELVKKYENK